MGRKATAVSEQRLIEMSGNVLRSFYSRNKEDTIRYMSDDFVWIGADELQCGEALSGFLKIAEKEFEKPPAVISDEKYQLLFHERSIWIIYGCYKLTEKLYDGTLICSHKRVTMVWKRTAENEIRLLHIHDSKARDIAAKNIPEGSADMKELRDNASLFKYIKDIYGASAEKKLSFKDLCGVYRYYMPSEILYLKADLQRSTVFTADGSFQVNGLILEIEKSMPKEFFRIHKSYLINTNYVDHICRYTATLKDGTEFPIGRDRYMNFKKFLAGKSSSDPEGRTTINGKN